MIVFGATECRKLCGFRTRKSMAYWTDPKRGEARFPEPCCQINGKTVDCWDPRDVMQWAERTRERRGLEWTSTGLARSEAQE